MPLLILLLIVVPIAELWAIVEVGRLIGLPETLALLLIDSLLGAWLLRRQGRLAWLRVRDALTAGRLPTAEAGDGALVILGGALLLTPGFITDALGFLLLLAPVRSIVRRLALRRAAAAGVKAGGPAAWAAHGVRRGMSSSGRARGDAPGRRPPARAHDVEGTAVEMDRGELGRGAP